MSEPIFIQGQEIADYRILKQIGKGGMAELFLARDTLLEREVVIKVLSSPLSNNGKFREQFLREARIQANLDNPYIVQIFRIFSYQDSLCLVMRHIIGTDLATVVKKAKMRKEEKGEKGALAIERAVHIFLQVLEGTGFAHKFGIIHGDIKPANILMDEQGRAKVADFGLSFFLSEQGKDSEQIFQGGTPQYMSPEQILNEKVDFRSDIYSLGATFFNMLTGESPMRGNIKVMDLLEYHMEGSLEGPKEILDEFDKIPPGIKTAVLKALQRDPVNRYQSCLEFSLAIKEEAPHEMYSELLRQSLLFNSDIRFEERVYLDKIAERRGLSSEEAKSLEENIRKEMGLPSLDFEKEYAQALEGFSEKGRGEKDVDRHELENTYVVKNRVSNKSRRPGPSP